jgi:hypothetical protein
MAITKKKRSRIRMQCSSRNAKDLDYPQVKLQWGFKIGKVKFVILHIT